jgi:hypothetical protein
VWIIVNSSLRAYVLDSCPIKPGVKWAQSYDETQINLYCILYCISYSRGAHLQEDLGVMCVFVGFRSSGREEKKMIWNQSCRDKWNTHFNVYKFTVCVNRGGPGSNSGLVMWDFVMDKSGAGAGFLRELRGFTCQSTFHLLLHNHLHYHPRLAQ